MGTAPGKALALPLGSSSCGVNAAPRLPAAVGQVPTAQLGSEVGKLKIRAGLGLVFPFPAPAGAAPGAPLLPFPSGLAPALAGGHPEPLLATRTGAEEGR